jgi:hypothetical protein
MQRSALAMLLLMAALPAAGASHVPAGPAFQVNAFTTAHQDDPAITADAAGRFIVTWASSGQDGDQSGVFGRSFDASGVPSAPSDFQVNQYTTGLQWEPAVAAGPGNLHFVWTSRIVDVQGRPFNGDVPAGPEFQVNSSTTGQMWGPSIAADGSGSFTVVWTEIDAGLDLDVVGRRFDANAMPIGSQFAVNSYTTGVQGAGRRAVATASDGRFVVVWLSREQDGSGAGIFAQRYDAAGAPQGPEFRVNDPTFHDQFSPAVASDAAGNFVVTWSTLAAVGGGFAVVARRFDSAGVAQGAEFVVNETNGRLYAGDVAFDRAGDDFVVVWSDYDGNLGVRGRVFDGTGPISSEFAVGTSGADRQPSVTFGAAGGFVVTWSSADGDGYGVFARRYLPDLIFADGFEAGDLARWSTSASDGGDLSVSRDAALDSTSTGLQGVVDDVAALYVQDDSPDDERRYRARFWIAFSEAPMRRVAAIVLRLLNGVYAVRGRARQDDNSQADTPFIELTAGPHAVELDLRAASSPDVPDGSFVLFVDGVGVAKLGNLDNSLARTDFVRLGALSVKGGANGTLYWDEFESRRDGYIGP